MKTTIAVVTCYKQPDYIRAVTLRDAIAAQPKTDAIIIKNTKLGFGRYFEVLWQLLKVKLRQKPDAILLTFRGQDILPLVLIVAGKTPVWFDEFVVPTAYTEREKHRLTIKLAVKKILMRLYNPLYRLCLQRCAVILSDTPSHADLSAKLSKVNLSKYLPVPVGADDKLFKPSIKPKPEQFQIFYYSSNMQPLHGINYVLMAAEMLKEDERIKFLLVGGKKPMELAVKRSIENGANIEYRSWVEFDELPKIMQRSHLNLGGPFGGTVQAANVITGKTYQSLAVGAATVVGQNDTTDQFFKDKVNSIIIPQADAVALRDAFLWAIDNQKELIKIGQNGRSLYEKRFSEPAIANILKPLVDSVRK